MKARPNILVLDPAGNMWGSERVLLDFLGSDSAQRRNIALCCPPSTPLVSAAQQRGAHVYPSFIANLHHKGKALRFHAAISLIKACIEFEADIIYVNQAGASRIALFVARLLRIPVVPHVRLLEDVKYVEGLHATARAMPRVLAISNVIGDAFNDIKTKRRVIVLYDAYAMANDQESNVSASQNSTALCCAGRLVPVKGQHILIEAIALLKLSGIIISLNLYGTGLPGGSFEAGLVSLVAKLGLSSQVAFRGFVSDIPAEMRHHLAVICPSHVEPLGRVIFEAWDSASVPIVGAFSGGAAEVINASQGGMLYHEQTPGALAEAIKKCLQLSSHERDEMIARGRSWLREKCNPEEYSRTLFDVLDMAVESNAQQ